MGSVGIITMRGNYNFGNRLQNFALQESVKRCGVEEVVSLRHTAPAGERGLARLSSRLHARLELIREGSAPGLREDVLGRFRSDQSATMTNPCEIERQKGIERFTREYIHESRDDVTQMRNMEAYAAAYSHFIVGSDQVWSPGFAATNDLAFLRFAEQSKRVAYAASVGIGSIPRHLRSRYRSGIDGIPHVSVREDRAAQIVKQLTGRSVPVVLDPTMLLTREDWELLADPPLSLAGTRYVLQFFLGDAEDERLSIVGLYARANDLQVVDIQDVKRPEWYCRSPLTFVGAISHASLVITDSFHAAVFCVIFGIPFLLKQRGAMGSRFETLLMKAGINHPKWGSLDELSDAVEIDWDSVNERIDGERSASLGFLSYALGV